MSKRIKLVLGGILLLVLILTVGSQAWALPVDYELEVPIGDTYRVSGIAQYIDVLYKFLIGAAGVIATVMIMYGGWMWIFAAGNDGTITAAKERITSALIGLALALASYLILFTVNPALVQLTVLSPSEISPKSACTEDELKHPKNKGEVCLKDCQCKVLTTYVGGEATGAIYTDGAEVQLSCAAHGVDQVNRTVSSRSCAISDQNMCGWMISKDGKKDRSSRFDQCLAGSLCVNSESDNVVTKVDGAEILTSVWHCKETSETQYSFSDDGVNYCVLPWVRAGHACYNIFQ